MKNLQLKEIRGFIYDKITLINCSNGEILHEETMLSSPYDSWYVIRIRGAFESSSIFNSRINIEAKLEIVISEEPLYGK